jgi:hypothetical protein
MPFDVPKETRDLLLEAAVLALIDVLESLPFDHDRNEQKNTLLNLLAVFQKQM